MFWYFIRKEKSVSIRVKPKIGKKLHLDDNNVELESRENKIYPEVN